jgi:hypothetical protein
MGMSIQTGEGDGDQKTKQKKKKPHLDAVNWEHHQVLVIPA